MQTRRRLGSSTDNGMSGSGMYKGVGCILCPVKKAVLYTEVPVPLFYTFSPREKDGCLRPDGRGWARGVRGSARKDGTMACAPTWKKSHSTNSLTICHTHSPSVIMNGLTFESMWHESGTHLA